MLHNYIRRYVSIFTCLLLGACGAPTTPPVSLEDVPFPELTTAETEVRRQLESARAEWQATLADPKTRAGELGLASGQLGELYQAYDLTEAAAACYRNAKRLAPREARWPYLLGVLHRLGGEPELAVENLQEALALKPKDVPSLLHLARIALDQGDFQQAESRAVEVLEIDSSQAAAHAVLGRVALARKDTDSAISRFQQALTLQPEANRLEYLLGQAFRQQGDLEIAKQHLARRGNRDAAFADPLMASLYTRLAGSAALMQRGASAKEAGALEASIEIYRQAVIGDPESPEARRDLGALLAQTGRFSESVDQYREAVRLEPGKGLNHFVLGLVLEQTDGVSESLEALQRAVDLEPEYREFRFALASRLAQAGDYAAAHKHFSYLLTLDEDDLDVRLERAKLGLELGDLAAALEDAKRVEQESSRPIQTAEALTLMANGLVRQRQVGEARNYLKRALELDPEQINAHFSLGNLEGMAGNFKGAIEHYRVVSGQDPERISAWIGEATALALLGRERDAVIRLEEALDRFPGQSALRFSLARLYLASSDQDVRDPQAAVRLAKELLASQRAPEHAELLIEALIAVGDYGEAIEMQEMLLKSAPPETDPRLVDGWRARLDELKTRV